VTGVALREGWRVEELVRRFYAAVWNRWDDTAVNELLHERDGFRSYRDKIRTAFPDFHNEIVDLVTSGDRAAARLCYSGHQQGEVLGVAATGVRVVYEGAAFFTPRDGQLAEVWVLGDVDGLRHQLAGGSGATP
jgi:predicted ester cyclase